VGYVAHRNNNGNTYKMAIIEGLKGPEFVISSTDGQSCSGQTPDIAWEGFQKRSCVRVKFWRGKRFSCKIDGAEVVILVPSCIHIAGRVSVNRHDA
ncbi:putative FY-rich, FY-rich, WD40/YVTN repeat-like-containing domain protein, partial [Tanacetum coccineum]